MDARRGEPILKRLLLLSSTRTRLAGFHTSLEELKQMMLVTYLLAISLCLRIQTLHRLRATVQISCYAPKLLKHRSSRLVSNQAIN